MELLKSEFVKPKYTDVNEETNIAIEASYLKKINENQKKQMNIQQSLYKSKFGNKSISQSRIGISQSKIVKHSIVFKPNQNNDEDNDDFFKIDAIRGIPEVGFNDSFNKRVPDDNPRKRERTSRNPEERQSRGDRDKNKNIRKSRQGRREGGSLFGAKK